jgi:cob(I)alamin adenosyltransferase
MKIYTKKGDQGKTSLFGGKEIEKNNIRLHAYGTVDELNSALGIALTYNLSNKGKSILEELQDQLFVLGADLATLTSKKTKIDRINCNHIDQLEMWIDDLDKDLPPLTAFILPGGAPAGANLHFSRTVCRRAERFTAELMDSGEANQNCLIYLNRLSDLLFVLARFENQYSGIGETQWISKK